MALHADIDLGLHQGRRRILELDELGIVNQNIAAAGTFDGDFVYAPGFTHFAGQLATDTPIATTLSVRIRTRLEGSLGGGGLIVNAAEFVVAVLTTVVGINRYSFYWGEARGLLTDVLGTGSTYCFSPLFQVRLVNTGAQPANTTTVEAIVCQ